MDDNAKAIIAEIRQLQQERATALEQGDAAFHQRVMADDCTIVHGAGFAESKQEFIPSLIRRLEIKDTAFRDVTYRVRGDTVIENGIFEMTVRQRLQPGTGFYRAVALYTIVWERNGGRWQIGLVHQTRVPQDD